MAFTVALTEEAAQRMPFENAEGSMSKLKVSEVAVRACEQAVQTLGGWGYIKDFPSRSGTATRSSPRSSRHERDPTARDRPAHVRPGELAAARRADGHGVEPRLAPGAP
jgi:acyl-CoA dehydrogenase